MREAHFEKIEREIPKRKRYCYFCGEDIEQGEECIKVNLWSVHLNCFGLRAIELVGMSKIEELFDTEYDEYLQERIAQKI